MGKLEDLANREEEILKAVGELQAEHKKIIEKKQLSCVRDFTTALYKFRDNFTSGKIKKDFDGVNDALRVLAETCPGGGHLGILESSPHFADDPVKSKEIHFMVGYVLSGIWRDDASFWKVIGRISEVIDNPDNMFKGGD